MLTLAVPPFAKVIYLKQRFCFSCVILKAVSLKLISYNFVSYKLVNILVADQSKIFKYADIFYFFWRWIETHTQQQQKGCCKEP